MNMFNDLRNTLFLLVTLLVIQVLLALSCHAIDLSVAWEAGDYGLSEERALEAVTNAVGLIKRDTNININITNFIKTGNKDRAFDDSLSFLSRVRRLRRWEIFFRRQEGVDDNSLKFVIVQPYKEGELLYLYGLAGNSLCYGRKTNRVAYAAAEETNHLGQPRFLHSVVGIAHEIGHLLGAEHSEDGIMYKDAYSIASPDISFSDESIRQITNCVR